MFCLVFLYCCAYRESDLNRRRRKSRIASAVAVDSTK